MALQCNVGTLLPCIRLANYVRQGHRLFRPISSQRFYSAAPEESKNITPVTPPSGAGGATATQKFVRLTDHKVNRLEKYLLVWGGKYKTVAEVPNLVSQDVLERARNKARIKINLMMIAATIVGCIIMVISGKKALKEGKSVVKINEDWHKQMQEESKKASS